jgi:PAS domain S-box-containing protein
MLNLPERTILSANPAACLMFGRSEEEICGIGMDGLVDWSDPGVPAAFKEGGRTGQYRREVTLVRRDGTRFLGEVHSKLFKDKNGDYLSCVIIRDLSERKKAEEALRLADERFSKAFNSNPAAMTIAPLDRDEIIYVNECFLERHGYVRENVIGVQL